MVTRSVCWRLCTQSLMNGLVGWPLALFGLQQQLHHRVLCQLLCTVHTAVGTSVM
jgi:hypothetical protein